jgi:hypothetical protein
MRTVIFAITLSVAICLNVAAFMMVATWFCAASMNLVVLAGFDPQWPNLNRAMAEISLIPICLFTCRSRGPVPKFQCCPKSTPGVLIRRNERSKLLEYLPITPLPPDEP